MGADWDVVSALAACCTAAIAFLGMFFVWRQIGQVNVSLRSSTNERLMSESLDILQFIARQPGTYQYFYDGKEPPETVDDVLKCATEMIANYMEHIVLQKDTLPRRARESWDEFVRDHYAYSPLVRLHLERYHRQYDERLHEFVKNVPPKSSLD